MALSEPPEEPLRLPLGTRISLYYILVFVILFVCGPVLAILFLEPEELEALRTGDAEMDVALLLTIEALLAPAVVAVTVGFVRLVDKKPLHVIGAWWPPGRERQAARDLPAAFLAAASLLTLWYAVAGLWVSFETADGAVVTPSPAAPEPAAPVVAGAGQVLLLALGFLTASCLEEWILRGYIYSTLREQLSWVHAGGIAALLFVLPQLASPGVTAPALVSAFLLGFVLAGLRELTGSLWPGVVFHGSWNFLIGCVLALPVSGDRVPALRAVTVSGPAALSGGDYGPEGSWLTIGLLLLAVLGVAGVLGREEPAADDEGGNPP